MQLEIIQNPKYCEKCKQFLSDNAPRFKIANNYYHQRCIQLQEPKKEIIDPKLD